MDWLSKEKEFGGIAVQISFLQELFFLVVPTTRCFCALMSSSERPKKMGSRKVAGGACCFEGCCEGSLKVKATFPLELILSRVKEKRLLFWLCHEDEY